MRGSNSRSPILVAGVDVGGARKGFHAVLLQGSRVVSQLHSINPEEVAEFCRSDSRVRWIGVDAPCRWRTSKRPRLAESELRQAGYPCFFTPHREEALRHPTDYYGWMIMGWRLFACLEEKAILYPGRRQHHQGPVVFETFPSAAARRLAVGHSFTGNKLRDRRALLQALGVETASLTNLDWLDAALCSVTALRVSQGNYEAFGNRDSGFILLP